MRQGNSRIWVEGFLLLTSCVFHVTLQKSEPVRTAKRSYKYF